LSIISAEVARTIVPHNASSSMKAGETTNTKIIRRDYIAKQAKITADWITDLPIDNYTPMPEF
jgi:hypothetical protein